MSNSGCSRLALLIDIDNVSAAAIDGILAELEHYGRCEIRLAFGDYERASAAWRDACIRCAIELWHYPALAKGSKNAADIALVIAAMDMIHTRAVDGFAIISSDTDFVRLATRIREAGLRVYGFGPWGTSERFLKACTRFFFTENLMPKAPTHHAIIGRKPLQEPRDADDEIRSAIARLYDHESGWIDMDELQRELLRHSPEFDPRTYGKGTLLELLKAQRSLILNQHPIGQWRVRTATSS